MRCPCSSRKPGSWKRMRRSGLLCKHTPKTVRAPQPDAHLSTQHTYTASHRGAPPPAGAAEERGPTLGPVCTFPQTRAASTRGSGAPPGDGARPPRPPAPAPSPPRPPRPAAYLARPRPRRRSAARPAAARRPGPARAQGGAASLRLPAPRPARGGSGRHARGAPSRALAARDQLLRAAVSLGSDEPPPRRWAARSGRGRPPLRRGSAWLEAAAATKMAAARSLGSGEGTGGGGVAAGGARARGRGGERRARGRAGAGRAPRVAGGARGARPRGRA